MNNGWYTIKLITKVINLGKIKKKEKLKNRKEEENKGYDHLME